MLNYVPENPLGVNDSRPESEQLKGHLIATAAFAVTSFTAAVLSQKTGTEFVGYPVAAASEVVALLNAIPAGNMVRKLGSRAVYSLLNLPPQSE
jgi:hypothetical protein